MGWDDISEMATLSSQFRGDFQLLRWSVEACQTDADT